VNTVVQNWDTYGLMTHNYYLYNDSTTGLLTWIPWDNNEALKTGRMKEPLSFSMDEVNEKWPLIRYLLDDPVYQVEYFNNMEAVINGAFDPEAIAARYEEVHELVRQSALAEEDGISQQAFENALTELIRHAEGRYQAASEFLSSME